MESESCIYVLLYALVSAVVAELFCWLFIYRHVDFAKLTSHFHRAAQKLDKKKEEPAPLPKKGNKPDKKLVQLERDFEGANKAVMATKSRSGMIGGIVHLCTFVSLKSTYDGIVLARMPFEPFGFVQRLSHRNVPGTDPRDCGIIFFYALCSMAIKPNLQRALGRALPSSRIPKGVEALAERWAGVTPEMKQK